MKEKQFNILKRSILVIAGLLIVTFTLGVTIGPKPLFASEKKPYKIDIYTFKVGSSAYVTGIALAELINKNSSWLKATAVETPGPTSNHKTVALKPELRKTVLWMSTPEVTFMIKKKWPPFDKIDYKTSRYVFVQGFGFKGFISLKPELKNLEDLNGKKVAVMGRTAQGLNRVLGLLFEAAGAGDVKFQYLGMRGTNSALKDGLVDAGLGICNLRALPDKFAPIPSMAQLMSTNKLSFLNFSEKTFENLRKKIGEGFLYNRVLVPAGAMGPQQKKPWTVMGLSQGFYADLEMPDDVVHEINRIIYENGSKFGEYSPALKIMGKDTMSRMDATEDEVHPGALKFFNEKGLKVKSLFQ